MVEKLRYVLILLLLALAGGVDSSSFVSEVPTASAKQTIQPALTQPAASMQAAAENNYFSASVGTCDISVSTPVVNFAQKAILRHRTDTRVAASEASNICMAMRTRSGDDGADPISYYIFGLRHILI